MAQDIEMETIAYTDTSYYDQDGEDQEDDAYDLAAPDITPEMMREKAIEYEQMKPERVKEETQAAIGEIRELIAKSSNRNKQDDIEYSLTFDINTPPCCGCWFSDPYQLPFCDSDKVVTILTQDGFTVENKPPRWMSPDHVIAVKNTWKVPPGEDY